MERKQVHAPYGFVTGLIMIVVNVVLLVTGYQENSAVNWLGFLPFLIGIILCCVAYSKANDGYVTFGQAFSSGFKATAIIALMVVVWGLISLYIWPHIEAQAIENASRDMEKKNLSQEQIDQALSITRKYFKVFMVAGALFSTLFFGAVFSLIGAAIAKKKGNPGMPQVAGKF